jgi:hypothetical protein
VGEDRYCRHSAPQRASWSGGPRYHSGDWTRRYRSEPQQDSLQIGYDRIYEPYALLSRSRIKKRTSLSLKSRPRFRACWVTHSPVGFLVQPASQTRRFACAMKKST